MNGVKKVLLGGDLPPGPDGEHAGLRADAPDLGPGAVGTQPGQQLVPDVLLHAHGPRVDLEDVGSAVQVRERELHLRFNNPKKMKN